MKHLDSSLDGSVAVVTGGAGHIGRSIARLLVARNIRVAIVDKASLDGERFVKTLNEESGIACTFCEANLSDSDVFGKLKNQIESHFGRVDFLVNNAAFYDDIPGWGVPFEQEGYLAWMEVLKVNLLAPFFLSQAFAALLKKSPFASIVNMSSIYGVVGPNHALYKGTEMTNPAVYAASKGGLVQLTKWLSTVMAPEVRVNAVSPGGVERGQEVVFTERYIERTPLARMAKESDVAEAVMFLLSPSSSYITGQNIMVDGGWTVW